MAFRSVIKWIICLVIGVVLSLPFFSYQRPASDPKLTEAKEFMARLLAWDGLLWAISARANPVQMDALRSLGLWVSPEQQLAIRRNVVDDFAECVQLVEENLSTSAMQFLLTQKRFLGTYMQEIATSMQGTSSIRARPFHSLYPACGGGDIFPTRHLSSILQDVVNQMYAHQRCVSFIEAQIKAMDVLHTKPMLISAVDRISQFLGTGINAASLMVEKSILILDPLLPVGCGCNVRLGQRWVMLSGPFDTPQKQDVIILHELLHQPIHSIVEHHPKLQQAIRSSACLFAVIQRSGAELYSYDTWPTYVEEMLVRAISYRLARADPVTNFPMEENFVSVVEKYDPKLSQVSEDVAHFLRNLATMQCRDL